MIPSTATLVGSGTATGGGGGGPANWDDINVSRTTSSISASNGNQTMGSGGTLNFAYALDAGLTVTINKNGVSQGSPASLAVSAGDTINMTAAGTGFADPETRTGTLTVSGLETDSVAISLERSTV